MRNNNHSRRSARLPINAQTTPAVSVTPYEYWAEPTSTAFDAVEEQVPPRDATPINSLLGKRNLHGKPKSQLIKIGEDIVPLGFSIGVTILVILLSLGLGIKLMRMIAGF